MLTDHDRRAINKWFLRRQRKRDLLRLLVSKLSRRGIGSLLADVHPRNSNAKSSLGQVIKPFQNVELLSRRLVLSEVRVCDMDSLVRVFPTLPEDDSRVYWTDQFTLLREVVTTYATWKIVEQDQSSVVGYCGLTEFEVDGQIEHEVGYRISEKYAGRGYATEAANLVMEFAFQQGLTRLISSIQPRNIASVRVAMKNGMVFEKRTSLGDAEVDIYVAKASHRQESRFATAEISSVNSSLNKLVTSRSGLISIDEEV